MTLIPAVTGTVTCTWAKGPGNTQVEEGHIIPAVLAFHPTQTPISSADVCHSLPSSTGTATGAVAYPLAMRGRANGAALEMGEENVYNALRASDGGSSRQNAVLTPDLGVRRLTPTECLRLMGWPDTHLDLDPPLADTHKYRLIGNGVVAPVAEWIGRRLTIGDLSTTTTHKE